VKAVYFGASVVFVLLHHRCLHIDVHVLDVQTMQLFYPMIFTCIYFSHILAMQELSSVSRAFFRLCDVLIERVLTSFCPL